ncbi:uncharacterized protein LOC115735753 [Rhodamnia argentea]|uniref:Uncharacterized protein LOC115735753 n=1 Tax=Rhodamnia argentea TaxID=178133 RepID=A0A8B8NKJ6_9MYRT|nr:uncharacterized protein LOC115735753 [Rhodamnia argentea]
MGICSSSESTSVATVKLVLHDGRLQEFSYPVKASHVLQKNPACFICDSDDMDYDDAVSAVDSEEDLLPGQLYFVLPVSWLDSPLGPAEMADLAVKASLALGMSKDQAKRAYSARRCGCDSKRVVEPVVLASTRDVRTERRNKISLAGGAGDGRPPVKRRGRSGSHGGRRGRSIKAKLSIISEEDE